MLTAAQLFGFKHKDMSHLVEYLVDRISAEHGTELYRSPEFDNFGYMLYCSSSGKICIVLLRDIVFIHCVDFKYNMHYISTYKTTNINELVDEFKKYTANKPMLPPVILYNVLYYFIKNSDNYTYYNINDMSEVVVCNMKSAIFFELKLS